MVIREGTVQSCNILEETLFRPLLFKLSRQSVKAHLMTRTNEKRPVRQPDRVANWVW